MSLDLSEVIFKRIIQLEISQISFQGELPRKQTEIFYDKEGKTVIFTFMY